MLNLCSMRRIISISSSSRVDINMGSVVHVDLDQLYNFMAAGTGKPEPVFGHIKADPLVLELDPLDLIDSPLSIPLSAHPQLDPVRPHFQGGRPPLLLRRAFLLEPHLEHPGVVDHAGSQDLEQPGGHLAPVPVPGLLQEYPDILNPGALLPRGQHLPRHDRRKIVRHEFSAGLDEQHVEANHPAPLDLGQRHLVLL